MDSGAGMPKNPEFLAPKAVPLFPAEFPPPPAPPTPGADGLLPAPSGSLLSRDPSSLLEGVPNQPQPRGKQPDSQPNTLERCSLSKSGIPQAASGPGRHPVGRPPAEVRSVRWSLQVMYKSDYFQTTSVSPGGRRPTETFGRPMS